MRETDFGAIDEAIADRLEEDERLVVFRIEDDLLELVLCISLDPMYRSSVMLTPDLYCTKIVHRAGWSCVRFSPAWVMSLRSEVWLKPVC